MGRRLRPRGRRFAQRAVRQNRSDDPYYESHRRTRAPPNQAEEATKDDAPAPKCPEPKAISVGAGLALDRHGREIDLRGKRSLGVNNTFLVEEDASGCRTRPLDKLAPGRYLLSIHYAERRFGDASLPDGCGCDDPEKNYVCETAVFSLRGDQESARAARNPATATASAARGRRAVMAAAVRTRACASGRPTASGPTTTPLCEWRGYRIDPADGVPLACVVVEVQQGKCDLEIVGCIEDDCSPRRLVKSNDLLYDLIRGCDLARISWISWAEWHRSDEQMSWKKFESLFEANGSSEFVVRFSRPVLREDAQARRDHDQRRDHRAGDRLAGRAPHPGGWRGSRAGAGLPEGLSGSPEGHDQSDARESPAGMGHGTRSSAAANRG